MTALLDVSELHVALGRGRKRTEILHGVDLTVAPGEIVGLIGETGSGKTTLARAVLGLVQAQSGTVAIDGREVTGLRGGALRAFRRSGTVQYIFQDPLRSLDPERTVFDTLVEGLVVRGRAELQDAALGVAQLVSLPLDLLPKYPGELSGGQRQRVAIARAIAVDPRLLICDEPVSALDASTRITILELLLRLRESRDIGVLLITHDLGSLGGVADRVVVLYHGRVVETGTTEEIFLAPRHPYTRLLVTSVPSIRDEEPPDPELRRALRDEVRGLAATSADSADIPQITGA
ncbi:ABC transporter ATP-binding protein [Sphaerisporangium perillae]|uniref:ABC transporter ATP-binding protein n=1 Tax=Sphaerisporangium perillae TaxID=2935860 RepID=UPI00200D78CF|nr:ATP-binding cassette domain-containing protein [Sphaerisporangium perillae]